MTLASQTAHFRTTVLSVYGRAMHSFKTEGDILASQTAHFRTTELVLSIVLCGWVNQWLMLPSHTAHFLTTMLPMVEVLSYIHYLHSFITQPLLTTLQSLEQQSMLKMARISRVSFLAPGCGC